MGTMNNTDSIAYRYQHVREWGIIRGFYGDRRAERSGVPLMNHIKEGVAVLEHLDAGMGTIKAFMVHPLFQADDDLARHAQCDNTLLRVIEPKTLLLAMEYRNQANAWLSDKVSADWDKFGSPEFLITSGKPSAGPLPEVRNMLIADKVQNYKDFLRYHDGTHPRSAELDLYFKCWLEVLGIGSAKCEELFVVMNSVE